MNFAVDTCIDTNIISKIHVKARGTTAVTRRIYLQNKKEKSCFRIKIYKLVNTLQISQKLGTRSKTHCTVLVTVLLKSINCIEFHKLWVPIDC